MGEFDDIIAKYAGSASTAPDEGEYSDLIKKYMPPEQSEGLWDKTKRFVGSAADQILGLSEYIPSPLKAAVQLPGATTGLLGRAIAPENYEKAYQANLAGMGVGAEPTASEKLRAAPDLGNQFSTATPEPESNFGRAAKQAAALGISIGTDPVNLIGGSLKDAAKLGKFAVTGERAAGIAPEISRLGAAGKAATKVLGSPAVGAIYAPEVVGGALKGVSEGNTPQALLMGGLAALMAKGMVDEFTVRKTLATAGIDPTAFEPGGQNYQPAPFPGDIPRNVHKMWMDEHERVSAARNGLASMSDQLIEEGKNIPRATLDSRETGFELRPEDNTLPEGVHVPEAPVEAAAPVERPAVWRNKDSDIPITISGEPVEGPDGRSYVPIKESNTFVPVDEIQGYEAQEAPQAPEAVSEPQAQPEAPGPAEAPVATPEAKVENSPAPVSNVDRLSALPDKAARAEIEGSSTQTLRDLARELLPGREKTIKKAGKDDLLPLVAKALKDVRARKAGEAAKSAQEARNLEREKFGLGPEEEGAIPEGETISGEQGLEEARAIDPRTGHILDLAPNRQQEAARGRERAAVRDPEHARPALDSRANLPDLQAIGNRVLPSDIENARLKTEGKAIAKEKKISAFQRAIGQGVNLEAANKISKAAEKNSLRRMASEGLAPEDLTDGFTTGKSEAPLPKSRNPVDISAEDYERWAEEGRNREMPPKAAPVGEGPAEIKGKNAPDVFREQGTGPSVADQERQAENDLAYKKNLEKQEAQKSGKPGMQITPEAFPKPTREGQPLPESALKARAIREKAERQALKRLEDAHKFPMDAGDLSRASLNQEFVGRENPVTKRISDRLIDNHMAGDEGKAIAESRKQLLDNIANKSGDIFKDELRRPGWRPWRLAVQDAYFANPREIAPTKVFEDFPGVWQAIRDFREEHGVGSGPPKFLGRGAFNGVFDIGGDTVARVSTSPVTPIPVKDWMLPFHKTVTTPEGWRVDFAPKAKPIEVNVEVLNAYNKLAKEIRKSGYTTEDLKPDNVGYYKGKLVVIDPGAVRPARVAGDPHYFDYITRQDFHYDGAAKATKDAIKVSQDLSKGTAVKALKVIAPEDSPLRPIWAKLQKGMEGAYRRGVKVLGSTIAKDLKDRGLISLEGQQIDLKNHTRDIATLAQLVRQPFEVLHVLAWDKEGKVVSDKAFSAGLANSVPTHKLPEFYRHMMQLEIDKRAGKIEGYSDVHNHPGGSPLPSGSGGDVDAFRTIWDHGVHEGNKEGIFTGYEGPVVTDHGKYGYMDYTVLDSGHLGDVTPKTAKLEDFNQPDKMFDRAPLGTLNLGDYKQLTADVGYISRGMWGNDGVRTFHLDNTGNIRAVTSAPFRSFKDAGWFAGHLSEMGSRESAGFPVLYFEPRSAAELDKFSSTVSDLFKRKAILDAVVPTKHLEEMLGIKVDPSHGTHVSLLEAMGVSRKVPYPEKPIAKVQQTFSEAAESLGGGKPKLPRRVEDINIEPVDAPEKPKPGGSPDIGINLEKDLPGLSHEARKEATEEWSALNDQLARAKVKNLDWNKMISEAETFLGDKSAEKVLNAVRGQGDIKAAAKRTVLSYMQWSTKRKEEAKFRDLFEKDPSEANKAKWLEAQTAQRAWGMLFVDRKTEAGRMLKMLDAFKHGEFDPRADELGRWMSAAKKRGLPDNVIDQLKDLYLNKPEEFADALEKALAPSWWDKFLEYRTAGLVSGPLTRMANIGSNQIFRHMRDAENILASGIDVVRAKLTGTERERYLGEAKTLLTAYKAALSGPEGALARWINEKGGFTLSPVSDQFGGSFLDSSRANQGAIKGRLGEAIRIPFKGLEVDDAFFKHLAASQEVFRWAYRQAYKNGFRGAELDKIVGTLGHQLLDVARHGPDSKHFKDEYMPLYKHIQEKMLDDTFQDPLHGIFQGIQTLQRNHPLVRLFLPFVKTPSNIAIESAKRTPIGFGMTYAAYKKGILSGGALSEELAKNTMGTTMGLGLALMAYNGMLTGGGPTDPNKQKLMKQTGWQPYSVKLGSQYFSYQRFEPLSSVIGFASDAAEFAKRGEMHTAEQAATKLMSSLKENLTNKTFLQGLSDLFTAWSDDRQFFGTYMRDQAGTLIPRIVSKAAVAIDPVVRKKDSLLSSVMTEIPGVSKYVEPVTAGSGQPVERSGTAVERFLSPVQRSSEKEAPVEQELIRLDKTLKAPSKTIDFYGKKIELSKSEYNRLLEARQQAYKKASRVIQDPSYQALPDNELDKRYRPGRTTKEDILDKVFRDYQKMASSKNRSTITARAYN